MSDSAEIPQIDPTLRKNAARDFLLYGTARLGLFLALTAVIQTAAMLLEAPVPLAISSLLALLVSFPLSMFVFKGLRIRVTREIAQWDAQRKAHKEWVKKELSER